MLFLFASNKPVAAQQQALDIVVLIDNSRSMETSDRDAVRITASRFLVDFLGSLPLTIQDGLDIRIGIASFGNELGTILPLTSIEDEAILRAVAIDQIDGTDFLIPFSFAQQQFAASENRQTAIILLTDGQPQGSDDNGELANISQYFDQLSAILAEMPADMGLLVVSIGDTPEYSAQWRRIFLARENAEYRRFEEIESLGDTYYRFVNSLLGLSAQAPITLLDGVPTPINLSNYLEHVLFSILKSDRGVRITLTAPDGNQSWTLGSGGGDELHEIYSLDEPLGGTWTVQADGGNAQLWLDRRLPQLVLRVPEGPQPRAEEVFIQGQLLRNDMAVEDESLSLILSIQNEKGAVVLEKKMGLGGSGIYTTTVAPEIELVPGGPFILSASMSPNVEASSNTYTLTIEQGEPTPFTTPVPPIATNTVTSTSPTPTTTPTPVTSGPQIANTWPQALVFGLLGFGLGAAVGRLSVHKRLVTLQKDLAIEQENWISLKIRESGDAWEEIRKLNEHLIEQINESKREKDVLSVKLLDLEKEREGSERKVEALENEKKKLDELLKLKNKQHIDISQLESNMKTEIDEAEEKAKSDPAGALNDFEEAFDYLTAGIEKLYRLFFTGFSRMISAIYGNGPLFDQGKNKDIHFFLQRYGNDHQARAAMGSAFLSRWLTAPNLDFQKQFVAELQYIASHAVGKMLLIELARSREIDFQHEPDLKEFDSHRFTDIQHELLRFERIIRREAWIDGEQAYSVKDRMQQ